ncbi:MAG TPA: GntR family transcriptional regulator [Bryobacteraceae bacterium]|nr:GntR family transcriptional regulator [Bryobacteraceae bacterium]
MAIPFEQLTSTTLRVRIAEKLREAILNGSLPEGERLVERKLASQFATSLTVVREALIELESEGFVVKKPNASTYVIKMTWDSAQKLFAVRNQLEAYAVEEAACLGTAAQMRHLEQLYVELLDAATAKDIQRFIRKDFSLHEAIWQMAGNEYLQAALRRAVLPIFSASAIRIASRRPFDLAQDAQLHLPLIDAIRNKDPRGARLALETAMQAWLAEVRTHMFSPNHEDHED